MRKTDIEVGKSYRGDRNWPLYGAKVRVLNKDIPMLGAGKQPGIRVQVERSVEGSSWSRAEPNAIYTVQTRKLAAPWTEQDDRNADEAAREAEQRVALRKRIEQLDGASMYRGGLYIDSERAEAILDKLGVPR